MSPGGTDQPAESIFPARAHHPGSKHGIGKLRARKLSLAIGKQDGLVEGGRTGE